MRGFRVSDERVTQNRGRGRPRPRKGGQTTGRRRSFERQPRISLAWPFITRTGPSAPPAAPHTPRAPLALSVTSRLRSCYMSL